MTFQQLPVEVLESIFQMVHSASVHKRNILQCALVCQTWYLPACRVLYEIISLKNTRKMLSYFNIHRENLGVFCKELQLLSIDESNDRPTEEYEQMLSHLPKIQIIRLEYCSHRVIDLEYLTRYAHLLKHVKEISSIKFHWNPNELQLYYNCITSFKEAIQNMALLALNTTIISSNGRNGNILSFLSDITFLNELHITNGRDANPLAIRQLSMFAILRSLPNLNSFTFRSDFEDAIDDYADYHSVHSRLRYLDISIPKVDKNCIIFMANNISELEELHSKSSFQQL